MSSRKWLAIACAMAYAVVLVGAGAGFGQQSKSRGNRKQPGRRQGLPSVSDLVKQFDKNGDGKLTKDEVVQPPHSRNFSRWDVDKNGVVTEAEIAKFRRGLGIPIKGTTGRPIRAKQNGASAAARFTIPDVDELPRVGRGARVSSRRAFVIKTQPHKVDGNKYVILTDHTEQSYLKPLERLAKHRNGVIVRVDDLALLYRSKAKMDGVRKQLQEANVRFLAIAPRMETYRENMLLGMLELITTIDSDPQLDAFPGFLIASGAKEFAGLIDRSINYTPQTSRELRPFTIAQVPSMQELRSLQKSGILRKMFARYGYKTPTVAIYSPQAVAARKLPGDQFWRYHCKSRGDFLKQFPEKAASEFQQATLLVMHGHGVPGMSCGVDISAIPDQLSAKIVMCGSCFAAAPKHSDFPKMRQAPGGFGVEARDAFALRAVDNGACVVFGHMRLSLGFLHLFPVLETWMQGKTVGEAYQELMNGIIKIKGVKSGGFVVAKKPTNPRRIPQNVLLYVIIGDPAIQPLERMTVRKPK